MDDTTKPTKVEDTYADTAYIAVPDEQFPTTFVGGTILIIVVAVILFAFACIKGDTK